MMMFRYTHFPNREAEVIARCAVGTPISILDSCNKSWICVDIGSAKDYAEVGHVSTIETDAKSREGVVSIPRGELNMRVEQSLDSGVVDRIPTGATVTILSSFDGWHFIESDGVKGFVMSKYIEL